MPQLGEIIKGRELGKKSHGKYIWANCIDCGKGRWVGLEHNKPRRDICYPCSLGRKKRPEIKFNPLPPTFGEIRNGKEIGRKSSARFIWQACIDCEKTRWVLFKVKEGKPVKIRCLQCGKAYALKMNFKPRRWKSKSGYVYVTLSKDDFFYPMTGISGVVAEHRLVVAKALGRCLHSWEIVHHKSDYAKDDNRFPETLQLVQEMQHNQITILERKIKYLQDKVKELKIKNKRLIASSYH